MADLTAAEIDALYARARRAGPPRDADAAARAAAGLRAGVRLLPHQGARSRGCATGRRAARRACSPTSRLFRRASSR